MQRFLKERIFNNRYLTVGKVKAASILVLLRDFEKQETITTQRFTESPREQRSFKTDYELSEREQEFLDKAMENTMAMLNHTQTAHCALHGHKGHSSEECKVLQARNKHNTKTGQSPTSTYC
jgi:hypothetical protein